MCWIDARIDCIFSQRERIECRVNYVLSLHLIKVVCFQFLISYTVLGQSFSPGAQIGAENSQEPKYCSKTAGNTRPSIRAPALRYTNYHVKKIQVAPSAFFSYFSYSICSFLFVASLYGCTHAQMHAIMPIITLITGRRKYCFYIALLRYPTFGNIFSRWSGFLIEEIYTDRILNNAKMVHSSSNYRKRTRNELKNEFYFRLLISNPIIAVIFDASRNSSLTLTHYFEQNKEIRDV